MAGIDLFGCVLAVCPAPNIAHRNWVGQIRVRCLSSLTCRGGEEGRGSGVGWWCEGPGAGGTWVGAGEGE